MKKEQNELKPNKTDKRCIKNNNLIMKRKNETIDIKYILL